MHDPFDPYIVHSVIELIVYCFFVFFERCYAKIRVPILMIIFRGEWMMKEWMNDEN